MLTYNQAEKIAIDNTVLDGKVYYSADAGSFYIFTIVEKNFPTDIPGAMFGTTFTAVDKSNGRVWVCSINDARIKNVTKIKGPTRR